MTCTNCGTGVDIKILKRCVEETWKALEQGAEQLQVNFYPCDPFEMPHAELEVSKRTGGRLHLLHLPLQSTT